MQAVGQPLSMCISISMESPPCLINGPFLFAVKVRVKRVDGGDGRDVCARVEHGVSDQVVAGVLLPKDFKKRIQLL